MGFGSNKPAYDALLNAAAGDIFEITIVKENGYNQWVNATKGASPAGGTINSAPARSGTPATAAPKSNYETPEERAKKQVYIVRQSSISSAISALAVGSKSKPDVKEIIEVARQFEDYVFGNSSGAPAEAYTPAIPSELDDDIPF